MAETMTYDPGTDTVTTGENLTPDEQESLKVGEELEGQQEELLAGKYKDAQELEKAYKELEAKLGDTDSTEETETEVTTDEPYDKAQLETFEENLRPSVELITEASLEFDEKGSMSPETVEKFSALSSTDLIKAYEEIQKRAAENKPTDEETSVVDLTNAQVNQIQNSVGGEQAYQGLLGWATENLPEQYVQSFDTLVDTGNVEAIQLALNGIKAQYEQVNGYEGRMLTGKGAKTSGQTFRSQQEVVDAMGDPRYDRDPAYRQDVMEKLNRSNIQF